MYISSVHSMLDEFSALNSKILVRFPFIFECYLIAAHIASCFETHEYCTITGVPYCNLYVAKKEKPEKRRKDHLCTICL